MFLTQQQELSKIEPYNKNIIQRWNTVQSSTTYANRIYVGLY